MPQIGNLGSFPLRSGPKAKIVSANRTTTEVRASFANPSAGLTTAGAPTQEFRVLVRKKGTGADPIATIEVWENGTFRGYTDKTNVAVSSTTGAVISAWWNTSLLTNTSGTGVEARVVGNSAGDTYMEVGALEWNASVTGTNNIVRVSFGSPSYTLFGGVAFQEFRVLVRKKGAGPDPTAKVELWENGTYRADVVGATTISSTTGTVLSGTWDAAVLANLSGGAVELRVVGTGSATGQIEVGAAEWNAVTTPIPTITQTQGLASAQTFYSGPRFYGDTTTISMGTTLPSSQSFYATSVSYPTIQSGFIGEGMAAGNYPAGAFAPSATPQDKFFSGTTVTASSAASVNLTAQTAAGTSPAPSVTPGATSTQLGAQGLASTGPAPSVAPGARSVTLTAQSAAASLNPLPGGQSLAALSATCSQPSASVAPGAVSVVLDNERYHAGDDIFPGEDLYLGGYLYGGVSQPSASVTPGAVTVQLTAQSAAGANPAPSVTPGAGSVTLAAQSAAGTNPAPTVTATVSVPLAAQSAATSQPTPTVSAPVSVPLAAMSGTLASPAPSVSGAAQAALAALSASATAPAPTVTPGAATQPLGPQSLAGTSPAPATLPGAVYISVGATTPGTGTYPGAGTYPDGPLTITATTTPPAVQTAGSVVLGALAATGTIPAPTVAAGPVGVTLGALALTGTSPAPSVTAGASVALAALTATGSTPAPTITAGAASVMLAALGLSASQPAPSVTRGPVAVTVAALAVTGGAPAPAVSSGIVAFLAPLGLGAGLPPPLVVGGATNTGLAALAGLAALRPASGVGYASRTPTDRSLVPGLARENRTRHGRPRVSTTTPVQAPREFVVPQPVGVE